MAGKQSVSPVTRRIRSTERSLQKFAISSPIRISTPFCSKSGLKSEFFKLSDAIGIFFRFEASEFENAAPNHKISPTSFLSLSHLSEPEKVWVLPDTGSFAVPSNGAQS